MRYAKINAWVDLIAFFVALASIVTGYVLRINFPFGLGKGSIDFLNLSYQSWYQFHFITSTLFVILIAVHLILHYRWIKNMCSRLVSKK